MKNKTSILWLLILITAFSCKKVKQDTNLPFFNTLKSSNSSIRMITLSGKVRFTAIINGNAFTLNTISTQGISNSCIQGSLINSNNSKGVYVTAFSPSIVNIPTRILDLNGEAKVDLFTDGVFFRSLSLKDNPQSPTDYYILEKTNSFDIVPIIRSISPPSGTNTFKIRVVNQSSNFDPAGLTGDLSLTDSKGNIISPQTSSIPFNSTTDYIELPYGPYAFKLFNQDNFQLPEASALGLDSGTTRPNDGSGFSLMPLTNLRYFQPGGVYTIFVNSNDIFRFVINSQPCQFGGFSQLMASLNSYSIISELSPSSNNSYARFQCINTIPEPLSLTMDGISIFSSIAYLGKSGFSSSVAGKHHFSVFNKNGEVILDQDITFYPNDNLSIWIYKKESSVYLITNQNDLSNLSNLNMQKQIRFLNLSQDIPFATFTDGGSLFPVNGQIPDFTDTLSGASATQNVPQGQTIRHLPYIFGFQTAIRVYESFLGPPLVIPGNPLPMISPLRAQDFIADTNLYSRGYFNQIPINGEPGKYTVALVGSKSPNAPPEQKAKLIIINQSN